MEDYDELDHLYSVKIHWIRIDFNVTERIRRFVYVYVMKIKFDEALELVNLLKKTVTDSDEGQELPLLVDRVCDRLKSPMLKSNPLFQQTVACLR